MLVDRGADDDDHVLGGRDHSGIGGGHQAGPDHPRQDLVGAGLVEGHGAPVDLVHGLAVEVEEGDLEARSAKAKPRGSPTWPQPPTMTTSRSKSMLCLSSAWVLVTTPGKTPVWKAPIVDDPGTAPLGFMQGGRRSPQTSGSGN